MYTLVLLRHGQSIWNKENRFTGWTDVELTEQGIEEAREAGRVLKEKGFSFEVVYCNVLERSVETTQIALKEMGLPDIPVYSTWQLNERHYGALQGLNKLETAQKYGEEQVLQWRRSFDVRPPALEKADPRYPGHDPLYRNLDESDLPLTESLQDTQARVLPYWNKIIAPEVRKGKRVLISASGNSLRALIKHLDQIDDAAITDLNIPTGVPLVYELDDQLQPIRHYYLGDPEQVDNSISETIKQGSTDHS